MNTISRVARAFSEGLGRPCTRYVDASCRPGKTRPDRHQHGRYLGFEASNGALWLVYVSSERHYGPRIAVLAIGEGGGYQGHVFQLTITHEQVESLGSWLARFLKAKDSGGAVPEPPAPVGFELEQYGTRCHYLWSEAALAAYEAGRTARESRRKPPG